MSYRKLKIVILGETGVGKTSILERLIRNHFHKNNQATLGAAYYSFYFNKETQDLSSNNLNSWDVNYWKFECWDTAGQERYDSLTPMYCRNAHVFIVVHDGVHTDKALKWIDTIKKFPHYDDFENIICVVQNKKDITPKFKSLNEIQTIDKEYHVSALNGENVLDCFKSICACIVQRYKPITPDVIFVEDEHVNSKKQCCKLKPL